MSSFRSASRLVLSVFVTSLVFTTGCGPGEGSTLIAPTADYQPTEDEIKNREAVNAARAADRQ